MNSGQQANSGLYEGGIGWAIMLGIFAVLIWIFWWFFHVEIREMVRWIRYAEMWMISWFVGSDYTVDYGGTLYKFDTVFESTPNYRKESLEYNHLAMFTAFTMQPLKPVFLAALGAGALWCMLKGPNSHYRTSLTIQTLIERQSKVFPVIKPFISFNPGQQPPRPPGAPVPVELPLFAEALGPEEWLAYNTIKVPDGVVDAESAEQAFTKQLGKPWRGAKNLDDYKQVLLAAFCLKASRKRAQCDDFLGRIAGCWTFKGGLQLSKDKKLLSEAQKILGNKDLAGKMMKQINRHAFETTALIRALQYTREEGGVLAPAEFVWLRAHDRDLWYPLNNVGRQSFHMEALGAMSHFKAEKMTQRPIPVPKVEHAVQTISEYMKSSRARPIPQLDYSQSKKRGIKKAV